MHGSGQQKFFNRNHERNGVFWIIFYGGCVLQLGFENMNRRGIIANRKTINVLLER